MGVARNQIQNTWHYMLAQWLNIMGRAAPAQRSVHVGSRAAKLTQAVVNLLP